MFCAYNDYLHITAKTLPFSYRIKDDSNFASCTSEIAAIALQFLLGEQTKAEPLIQQVAFAKLEILFANSIFLQTEPQTELQTELQTEMDITICLPILSYVIFCLQIFVFNQIFSCSMILSLSPLPFVDSRSNGRE